MPLFLKKYFECLGRFLSKNIVEVGPEKAASVAKMKPSSNLKELHAISGLFVF